MNTFTLRKGMEIGAASAATQVEGGVLEHSWMDWYRKGHIVDGSSPERADNHYELWREDTALMKELGMQICRLGIEWARVEPREGAFDQEAINHYVEEVKLLRSYGIKPLVTLHHFTNPMWFEEKGAFARRDNLACFLRFVEKMVSAFGEMVQEYITINEPNVYSTFGYFFGSWPPGKKSFRETVKVMSLLVEAHVSAYQRIHQLRSAMGFKDTKVSFANHMRVFSPENPKKWTHRFYARLTELFFQGSLTQAMMTGKVAFPLRGKGRIARGRYCDFIALNYYTRSAVSGLQDGVEKGVAVNDLGWEIYPAGIVECAQKLYDVLPLPIYVTENGTCDNADAFRCLYLHQHLQALCESGLPVERYYHWCFCDNFEWLEGESARFGLVQVDYETQARSIKKSGYFLRDVIAQGGVDDALYNKYVAGQQYPTNA